MYRVSQKMVPILTKFIAPRAFHLNYYSNSSQEPKDPSIFVIFFSMSHEDKECRRIQLYKSFMVAK